MAGVYAFLCWGEKPPSNKNIAQPLAALLKSRGAIVYSIEQTGVGHAFAPEYQKQAHDWLKSVVIPGLLKPAVAKVESIALARPAETLGSLASLEVLAAGGEYESRLKAVVEKIDAAGQKELQAIEAGLADGQPKAARQGALARARLFVKKYAGSELAVTCSKLLERAGG